MATCTWESCTEEVPVSRYSNGQTYQPKYCEPHRIDRARELGASRQPNDRKINSSGYAEVRVEGGGWKLEQRMVMEQVIGRPLRPGEMVIRKNGDRLDNRPENLRLRGSVEIVCPHCGKDLDEPVTESLGIVVAGLLPPQSGVGGV